MAFTSSVGKIIQYINSFGKNSWYCMVQSNEYKYKIPVLCPAPDIAIDEALLKSTIINGSKIYYVEANFPETDPMGKTPMITASDGTKLPGIYGTHTWIVQNPAKLNYNVSKIELTGNPLSMDNVNMSGAVKMPPGRGNQSGFCDVIVVDNTGKTTYNAGVITGQNLKISDSGIEMNGGRGDVRIDSAISDDLTSPNPITTIVSVPFLPNRLLCLSPKVWRALALINLVQLGGAILKVISDYNQGE